MSDNSDGMSDKSIKEEDTKPQTERDKQKERDNSQENIIIKNINLIDAISKTLDTILEKNKE
jgi:RNA processing factor Prp31